MGNSRLDEQEWHFLMNLKDSLQQNLKNNQGLFLK